MKPLNRPPGEQVPSSKGLSRRTLLGVAATSIIAKPAIAQGTKTRTLRYVPSNNSLTSLDPMTPISVSAIHARAVFDTLYGVDDQLKPRPQMIEGHDVSDDRLVWTFKLREGLKFHDGEPVRATDCVASIVRWGKRDVFGLALTGAIDRMEAADDRTFKIYLKKPMGPVLDALAHPVTIPLYILPERLAQVDPFEQIPEVIGSGPYRFLASEYVSGSRAAYARFESYVPRNERPEWTSGGKVANFDRLEWLMIPDKATATAALKAGEVDWMETIPHDLIPTLTAAPSVVLESYNQFGVITLLAFNFQNPPFNNVAIRRAVRDALHQEDFVQAIVGTDPKLYRLCQSMFGCGLPGVLEMGGPPKDIETSRKAIREAGYKGEKVVMLDAADSSILTSGARIAADLMTKLGMNVDVQSMDFATLLQRRVSTEPVERGGWSVFCNAADMLNLQNPGVDNYVRGWVGGYKNEAANELIDQWLAAGNPAEAQGIFEQIQKLSYDDVPMIPLGQFQLQTAYSKTLTGVVPASNPQFWNVRRI